MSARVRRRRRGPAHVCTRVSALSLALGAMRCGARVTPDDAGIDAAREVSLAPPDAAAVDAVSDALDAREGGPPLVARQPAEAPDERVTRHPVAVSGNARSIAVGSGAACIRTLENTVACWGSNSTGALADRDTTRYAVTAETVPGLSDVVSLTATGGGFCAARATGAVWCWGAFFSASLAGDELHAAGPLTQLVEAPSSQEVSGTAGGLCVRDQGSSPWCWGVDASERFGPGDVASCALGAPGSSGPCVRDPRALFGPSGSVSCGPRACCAVDLAGTVRCLGDNSNGELSGGVPGRCLDGACERASTPVAVALPRGVSAVTAAVGDAHVCALAGDGAVLCWGANALGQLGRGDADPHGDVAFAQVAGAARGVRVYAGATCAVLTDGTLWCWGDARSGALGFAATTAPVATPVRVELPAVVSTVSLGARHGCALLASGEVWCWGENARGFLGEGSARGPRAGPARRM